MRQNHILKLLSLSSEIQTDVTLLRTVRGRGVLRVRLAVGPSNEVALNVLGEIVRLVTWECFTCQQVSLAF